MNKLNTLRRSLIDHPRRWMLPLGVLLVSLPATVARADDGPVILRVEVDFQMVVPTLNDSEKTPLATCAMSPVQGESEYMTFEVNHATHPTYAKGGLHLQVYDGESHEEGHAECAHSHIDEQLVEADVVSWTQSMTLSEGMLTYEVTNGSSVRWGSFGTGELVQTVPAPVDRLNDGNISTFFAVQHVSSLVIKRVRTVTADGAVTETVLNRDLLAEPIEEPTEEPPTDDPPTGS